MNVELTAKRYLRFKESVGAGIVRKRAALSTVLIDVAMRKMACI